MGKLAFLILFTFESILGFAQKEVSECEKRLHGGETKAWAIVDSGFVMGGSCSINDISFLFDKKQRLQVRECKDGVPVSTLFRWSVVNDKFGYNILKMKNEKGDSTIYYRIVFSRTKKKKKKVEELRLYEYDFIMQQLSQGKKTKYYILRGTA